MEDSGNPPTEKKPFNKQRWREKKYGHSHKVEKWKENHKNAAKMKYQRLLKKEQKNNPNFVYVKKDQNKHSTDPRSSKLNEKDIYNQKVSSKELKKQEFLKKQQEKSEAIKKYKEKKIERFKVLNSKTKKGQPRMGGRIELLLAKIEEQCKNDWEHSLSKYLRLKFILCDNHGIFIFQK